MSRNIYEKKLKQKKDLTVKIKKATERQSKKKEKEELKRKRALDKSKQLKKKKRVGKRPKYSSSNSSMEFTSGESEIESDFENIPGTGPGNLHKN